MNFYPSYANDRVVSSGWFHISYGRWGRRLAIRPHMRWL